jgi:hypothetical protein
MKTFDRASSVTVCQSTGMCRPNRSQPDDALVGDGRQPGGDGAAAGNDQIRRDFGQRLEDEGAQVQARMRQGQARQADELVAVEQQVEVERARAVAFGADAAEALFDVKQGVEQGFRRQRRFPVALPH